MAELAVNRRAEAGAGYGFFFWMAAVCVLLAFGGFTPTYFMPLAEGSLREVNAAVHIHGTLFFGWTLLLLYQTSLVAQRRTARHRAIGMAGIAVATAMLIFGLLVNLLANAGRLEAGDTARAYRSVYLGWSSMVLFAPMVFLAIRNVAKPDVHKRLMLLATCATLGAATARLYLPLFDFELVPRPLALGTVDAIVVAMLVYDWRTLGRPHRVTLIGGSALLLIQLLQAPVIATEGWHAFVHAWISLAG